MKIERWSGWRHRIAGALVLLALIASLWWWRERRSPASTLATATAHERTPWIAQASARLESPVEPVALVDEGLPEPIPSNDASDPSVRAQAVAKLDETIQLYRETMKLR